MRQRCKRFCFQWIAEFAALSLLLMLISGCKASDSRSLHIGVTVYNQSDTFISSVMREVENQLHSAELQYHIKINLSISDGAGNQTTQMEQVNRFLKQGCDIICVNIVDRTAAASMIDLAQDSKVPIIFFNREPVEKDINRWEKTFYVGARAEQSGSLQGELVAKAWAENLEAMDRNGDGVLQYVMLEGEPGHQDALLRTEYSIEALTDAGIATEKLAGDTANWNRAQAMAKTQKWIKTFSSSIEAVIANNDDMALGAIDAFEAENQRLPLVVGVDATASALEAIRLGKLYGTVLNDSIGMAEAVVQLALSQSGIIDEAPSELEEDHYIWLEYKIVQ